MASSADKAVVTSAERRSRLHELAASLSGSEADRVAQRLMGGESLSSSLTALPATKRPLVEALVVGLGLNSAVDRLVDVLLSIGGARTVSSTRIDPLWTMPGHLAQSSPLTTSVPAFVRAATTSLVCSTFNFTASSELWSALSEVAQRPDLSVRLYMDTAASQPSHGWHPPPTAAEVAQQLSPGRVFRTVSYEDHPVRNHAKLVIVDHRFVLVTSANFSYSAAYKNIEFGIKLDNPALAESVERELRNVEGVLFDQVAW